MTTPFDHGGNVFAIARSLGLPPEEILDFSASINPLGPAPGVREAVAEAFDNIVHYPDSDCTELREALAVRHGVRPTNICMANGSTELIYLLARLAPGKRALVIAPSFSEYSRALDRDRCSLEKLILDADAGFPLPLEEIEERLKRGFDLLIIGNPGNPTGTIYPLSLIERLLELCRVAGTTLVIDEAFMDFCEECSVKKLAAGNDGILLLRSMTKFYALPGMRLGFAVAGEKLIGEIASMRAPWSVSTLAQAAGLASLAAEGYAQATREVVEEERDHLISGLSSIPGLTPFTSVANYLLVRIRTGISAGELARRLIRERILIRDCANFAGLDERYFRVAVRRRGENDRLLSALVAHL